MDERNALTERIKNMMVENLMLQVTAADIADDQPLFGPGSLGLDSVDALQLVVMLDKNFGLKIPDPATAKVVLPAGSVAALAAVGKLPSRAQDFERGEPATTGTTTPSSPRMASHCWSAVYRFITVQ